MIQCKVCGDDEIVDLLEKDFAKIKPYLDAGLNKYEDGEEIETMRPCPCCSREGRLIPAAEMPKGSRERMSASQRSYLDEFTFFQLKGKNEIEAWYAEELLAVWDGQTWRS